MTKTIKLILIITGVALLLYGSFRLVTPEASVDLGPVALEAQDNTNAYITIILGFMALVGGIFTPRKA
ncbi:MAG: hypothetical protein ABNH00_10850 [Dokdonia sp.]|jgi:uncharacterized membrane protein|nr:hypothetical protein [Cytophagaceae bacterium]